MHTAKKLAANDVTFTLTCTPEDIPVRGNLVDGGPGYEAEDRALEDTTIARLDSGDAWAWCRVTVTAEWQGLKKSVTLGGCSYQGEAEFRADGYYLDLCDDALYSLNSDIVLLHALIKPLFEGV